MPSPFLSSHLATVESSRTGVSSCTYESATLSSASSTPSRSTTSRCAAVAPNISPYHATAASRSRTATATWSISVSWGAVMFSTVAPEQRDPVLAHSVTQLGVLDAQALTVGEAQDADLPLVEVVVDLVGGLADRVEGEHRRQDRLDAPLADQAVGVPGLAVVREVRALDRLELHPEVPVVVLEQVAGRGRAGDDGAAAGAHEHRRAH